MVSGYQALFPNFLLIIPLKEATFPYTTMTISGVDENEWFLLVYVLVILFGSTASLL